MVRRVSLIAALLLAMSLAWPAGAWDDAMLVPMARPALDGGQAPATRSPEDWWTNPSRPTTREEVLARAAFAQQRLEERIAELRRSVPPEPWWSEWQRVAKIVLGMIILFVGFVVFPVLALVGLVSLLGGLFFGKTRHVVHDDGYGDRVHVESLWDDDNDVVMNPAYSSLSCNIYNPDRP